MIPRDYTTVGWVGLHSIRTKLMQNKLTRVLKGETFTHIDEQIRIVQKHIDNFNKPPYWKRKAKP